jgi:hypothetical protein
MRIPLDGGHFFAEQGALSAVYLAHTSESATLHGLTGEPTPGNRIVLTGLRGKS